MINNVLEDSLKSMQGEFSVLLTDPASGRVIYERNADRQVPSASTIKVLIMIEAYRSSLLGKLDLDGKVRVESSEKVDFSIITKMNTDLYTVRDLILLMMTISDNTATNVLIDILGMESINSTGESLGLSGTVLQRKMMDFEAARQGRQNLTTPRDMVSLMEKLYRKSILTNAACSEMLEIMGTAIRRDSMTRELPPELKVAHKPGELDELNHDVGIVYSPVGDYILGIFATGLKDNIAGRNYIAQLSKEVFDQICILGGIE